MYIDDNYTRTTCDSEEEEDYTIIIDKERYEDYRDWEFVECLKASWHDYAPPLHPREDYQKAPFWLRIRSNPVRSNYH